MLELSKRFISNNILLLYRMKNEVLGKKRVGNKIEDLDLDLEIKRVIGIIREEEKKRKSYRSKSVGKMLVCIQLPDGLKPVANEIQDVIEENTNSNVIIWAGSCFGACDTPRIEEVDLLIQWGHSKWPSKREE